MEEDLLDESCLTQYEKCLQLKKSKFRSVIHIPSSGGTGTYPKPVYRTMFDFHNSTDTLKFWPEKRAINKTFFVFHLILMKLGEVVVIHVHYNFTKFHQNRMKNKKVLLIARFSVQNFKLSVESWKSYIHSGIGQIVLLTALLNYLSWVKWKITEGSTINVGFKMWT